jgi:hypothetical protein
METTKGQRKKKFVRDKDVSIRLRERDVKIIEEVYRYRFLNSEHIVSLLGESRQGILRRLNLLYHNGFLDRPKVQLLTPGNNAMVYGLGNDGARLLAERLDLILPAVDWTTKNREAKRDFFEHTLMVADFMIMIRLACQQTPGVEFVSQAEIIRQRPTRPKEHDKAIGWRVEITRSGRKVELGVLPDRAFGLRIKGEDGKSHMAFFFLEADRATMPIKRPDLYRTSFYKKLIGYYESWKQGIFSENFGFKSPRLLTITTSVERVKSMIEANKELDPRGEGLRMFLFAPIKAFQGKEPVKVLSQLWLNGRSEKTGLLD